MTKLSTLCYIEQEGKYLMLHRTVKKNDVNKDKWIGVGGHFEKNESPEECLLREVKEETGYTLTSWKYRGIVTFVYGEDVTEYMSLYTADGFTGEPIACDEGELEWVDKEQVWGLNLWEGDKIFFRLLDEEYPFFSLKLVYDTKDTLQYAALDGIPLELFEILNADGSKSGVVQERGVAHREGSLHPTSHVWIVRPNQKSGYDLLLQKRSADKDSNPGCYDISSAGHVSAGDDYLESAIRELNEELGIWAEPEELQFVGKRRCSFEAEFYGRMFRDQELSHIYIYRKPVEIGELHLQESEVEDVCWMDYQEVCGRIQDTTWKHCIYKDELDMLGAYLGIQGSEPKPEQKPGQEGKQESEPEPGQIRIQKPEPKPEQKYERVTHEFEPVFDENSKILILGTFPSVKSRENNFYYGHPQNRFWKIIALLTDSRVPETIAEKKKLLLEHGIAVWDVISSCEIIGSSDSSIRNVVPADLEQVLSTSNIRKIYANGGTAKRLYEKYSRKKTGREIIGLPSTSPANASYSMERLMKSWGIIKEELE